MAGFLILAVLAQSGSAAALFSDHASLRVTLQGPLSRTLRDASATPDYLPYELAVGDVSVTVGVQPRGSSRREVCKFPPLRLKFEEPDEGSMFAGQRKLKLVTHCNSTTKAEQNVLEEYAAYRVLNIMTPASFRVRLLRVNYVDTERPQRRVLEKWGFIIEDVEALAARLGGSHVEPSHVEASALDPRHASTVGLFQYLIGNTDYSLTARRPPDNCCHNAKVIQLPDVLLSIPYDFDQAGMVDAVYAGANPVYAARDVRIRHYLGICTSVDVLQQTLVAFRNKAPALYALLEQIEGMRDATRARARRYVEQFYTRMEKTGVAPLHERCQ